MNGPAVRIARRWVAGAAVMILSGCASLFVANPPGHLYRLSAGGVYPASLPRVTAQLLVDLPQAPAGIDTSRIALSQSPLSLDYYADSEWTDQVPGLVQTVLLASFENSRAITAIGRESVGLRADFVLKTEIRHFEAVGTGSGSPPNVWIAMTAKLVAMPQREIIAQASFERHVPATAADVPAVVAAFNAAADAVARDIVVWTLTNPALSRKRR
ncbi:MAG TPA: ABC-type transport auxiliary lipoprotein family protein [Stellaceae bacterium]|nr:ABC-type transport auxiliary lipoprotein family protein [Stellaceae bacterium]